MASYKGKFKLVYIVHFHQSMSGWGNREPGNYTHINPMPNYHIFILPIPAFTTQILKPSISLWVLVCLVISDFSTTITHNQQALFLQACSDCCSLTLSYNTLFGASQYHCHWKQCLLLHLPQLQQQTLTLLFPFWRKPYQGLWVSGPAHMCLWIPKVCFWSIISLCIQGFIIFFSILIDMHILVLWILFPPLTTEKETFHSSSLSHLVIKR